MARESDPRYLGSKLTENTPGCAFAEGPLDYTNGYRVTVGWSEEDDAWIAEAGERGLIAHGITREAALLELACAACCMIDAVDASPSETTGDTIEAWQLFDRDGNSCAHRPEVQQRVAELKCQEFNATPELAHKAPYTVRPLYSAPPAELRAMRRVHREEDR